MSDYTMSRSDFKTIAPSGRLPYAKISAWCIQHLNNAQRLVIEGIFCELAVGESTIATSAQIAGWANVSEATVSRALPGLAAKGLIALSRVYYSETGRTRWSLRHLPAQPNGSYAPGCVGSAMDVSAAQSAPVGSDMDGSAAGSAAQSISPDSGVSTPQLGAVTDSAAGRLTSMSDPRIFYDSENRNPNKHACTPPAFASSAPDSRTSQPYAAPPLLTPASRSETPTVPAAFAELCQRGVYAPSVTKILTHHPTMTGAEFDRLLDQVRRTRTTSNPVKYLSGILQRGEMLDPPSAAEHAVDGQPQAKASKMVIIFADIDPDERSAWMLRYAYATSEDERHAVVARFTREVLARPRPAADPEVA